MKNDEIQIILDRMEDKIMDYKLSYSLFENYCELLFKMWNQKLEINYSKYINLLENANVIEPQNQTDYLKLYDYKNKLKLLRTELEQKKSR